MNDLSVINMCLLTNPHTNKEITLTKEQLVLTDRAINTGKTIWEVETGLGKTYMVLGMINSLMPLMFDSNKKIILVAPTNKIVEFSALIREHTMLSVISSTGQQKDVAGLISNWNKTQVFVLTPSIWGSSLEFNCHVFNNRNNVLACLWDEADGVADTGYLTFLELSKRSKYSAMLNATPIGKSQDTTGNNESLRVLYNLMRGINRFNESYTTFFNRYTTESKVSSKSGNAIYSINFKYIQRDFGDCLLNLNREELGVQVSFNRIDFHRCKLSGVQTNALSNNFPIRQVLYSPETSGAFKLTTQDVPALAELLKIILTLPTDTNKIIFIDNKKSVNVVYRLLYDMGYKVFIINGENAATPESRKQAEEKYNQSTGAIMITNIERAGNLGSASNIIVYDTPVDIIQYIARAIRGFISKYVTLDWIYYPDREIELMVNVAEKTISNTIHTKRTYDLIIPLLDEVTAINAKHPKLKIIREMYLNYLKEK